MSKYESMSDFEINKLIHIKRCQWGAGYYDRVIGKLFPHKEPTEKDIYKAGIIEDYCNSWDDMGPIIETITEDLYLVRNDNPFDVCHWEAMTDKYGSILKAAAIIYLESLESNNE